MCLRSHSKQEAEPGFKYRHSFQSLHFQIPCYLWVAIVQSLCRIWRSVMSHSLRPHGLQHSRLPCPPLSPRVCSNSCPLSRWCPPTTSSCVVPFSSCLQSFPTSGSFPISQFFTSAGQSIGASASASVLSTNIQGQFSFSIGWSDLLAVQGTLKSLLQHQRSKATILQCSAFFMFQLSRLVHDYWKNHSFGYPDLCRQSGVSAL